ncbi:MAG TPA: peroxiredoxin [Xanthobacteraceae bacterium]|nr:peroxiredoxin [Xanthobacteraceae bacterium]
MIKVGDRLPGATFRTIQDGKMVPQTTDEIFKGKRVVLVGVPGAFTPTCHKNHVPGYVKQAAEIRAKNVDTIAVTAVNDHWVMHNWSEVLGSGPSNNVLFLADNNADFAKAAGLEFDATSGLGGLRSRRYSMLVEDGVVKVLNLEPEAGKAEVTSADNLIKAL